MGGGGFPPPVLPRCPGSNGARNVSAWPSVLPPGRYTPQLVRSLALPLLVTLYFSFIKPAPVSDSWTEDITASITLMLMSTG